MEIVKISPFEGCSLLGMNGGCPESPDGKRMIYAIKDNLLDQETKMILCNTDLTDHRELCTIKCGNHNGPSATFIDNSLVVFRDGSEGIGTFIIMDVDTLEIKYKIRAKESHCAESGKYPFSVDAKFMGKNPEHPEIDTCGIYILDVYTGKITLVMTEDEIKQMVSDAGYTALPNVGAVSHVQLNPSGTSVMMRLGVPECPVFGALGCKDLLTGKYHIIPDKPVHQLWYDDDTYMATRQFNHYETVDGHETNIIECETSYLARFTKDGQELEVLGGVANHMDGSPDREYFTGDRCYPGYATDIYLYKKGSKEPILTIPIPQNEDTVWVRKVHANPSFSKDGKRIYFNRPDEFGGSNAYFVDISAFLDKK
ncbi:MAG: hypothetical protein MJ124_01480 [Lachnospiraceae bacterium]|nr:hypothetical protein [Lachnospiraceae bacterium]